MADEVRVLVGSQHAGVELDAGVHVQACVYRKKVPDGALLEP
jgi:hypothetical protein